MMNPVNPDPDMVLEIVGNSEMGAHVRSNLCYLICLRILTRSRGVTNRIIVLRQVLFSFMRAQRFLSYHQSTMDPYRMYCSSSTLVRHCWSSEAGGSPHLHRRLRVLLYINQSNLFTRKIPLRHRNFMDFCMLNVA